MKPRIAMGSALFCAIMAAYAIAFAHAFPDSSQPEASSVLSHPPTEVYVHFDNALDPAKSSVRVLDTSGQSMAAPAAVSADNRSITAPLKPLAPGQYFVKWSAYSADGDHTMGAFSFTVAPSAHR